MLPTPLASLLLVLLAAGSTDALPLPGLPLDTSDAPPTKFDPLYLSLVPSAMAVQSPSEPPPRQAVVAPTQLVASQDAISSPSTAVTVMTTVYETRAVTMTVSMPIPQQQQQVEDVSSAAPIVPTPSPFSSAVPVATSTIPLTTSAALPPPPVAMVTQTLTVTAPPPAEPTPAPVAAQDVTPTNPQLTPVFPTTTWALPPTYSDLSSFKIKKFAVGKENFQVVQGIPAWASAGYVAPADATPAATDPAEAVPSDSPAPAAPTDSPAAPTGGLLDGLLGALGRRQSHPHSGRRRTHPRSLQPIVARAQIPGLTPNPSVPTFAWNNATDSALQVLFPVNSSNPSSSPVGGGDFYAQPYDMSSASNMTLEYSVFFPLGFDFVKGGKLPGLYGGKEGCSGGDAATDCWSSRMMWRRGGKGEIYLYVPKDKQTPRLCSTPPQSVCDSTYGLSIGRGAFTFKTGGWTTVRQDVWMNTPGVNDGGFNIFIDGQFIFGASDVLYRQAPTPVDAAPEFVDDAAAPVADASATSTPPTNGTTLAKRYDDGMYHPTGDDGQYHPGVIHQADVQTTSVASATDADVPQPEGEQQTGTTTDSTSMPEWESDLENGSQTPESTDPDVQAASAPAPTPTQDEQAQAPAWTPTDQEIPAPAAPSADAQAYSPPASEEDFQPTSSSDQSIASADPESEESVGSQEDASQTAPFTVEASVPTDTQYYPATGDQADDESVTTSTGSPAASPYVDPSPCPTPSSSVPAAATPTPPPAPTFSPMAVAIPTTLPLPSPSAASPPTAVVSSASAASPNESAPALAAADDALPPPPPPASDDPEQSPSSEPVPNPGINTDGPMLGFTGIFFSTFFGGHGLDWASPTDQDVWFNGFTIRTNL